MHATLALVFLDRLSRSTLFIRTHPPLVHCIDPASVETYLINYISSILTEKVLISKMTQGIHDEMLVQCITLVTLLAYACNEHTS